MRSSLPSIETHVDFTDNIDQRIQGSWKSSTIVLQGKK
jgi:hypothetical protein